jgi:hypothetical protein
VKILKRVVCTGDFLCIGKKVSLLDASRRLTPKALGSAPPAQRRKQNLIRNAMDNEGTTSMGSSTRRMGFSKRLTTLV